MYLFHIWWLFEVILLKKKNSIADKKYLNLEQILFEKITF